MNSSKPIPKGQIEDYISDSTQDALDLKADIGSTGVTNLTYTPSPTSGVVVSDTGTDATIPLADVNNAGLLSPADKVKLNNTSGVNSGNQTSIVGITGTKAQFNTAVTDGDILYVGDVSGYTTEEAQDAIGTILIDTSTIDFTYDDVIPSISAIVKPNSITAVELSNSIGNSEFINDENFARVLYVDAKVADEIVDGTTVVAPSQNAVFDALSLKLDKSSYTGNAKNLDDRIIVLENLQDLSTNFTGQAYAIWTGVGLIFDVIYPDYYIEGVLFSGATEQVTLSASDPSLPRLDIIAVDATGAIVIPGAPATDPSLPTIDNTNQIQVSAVLVNAGATTPEEVAEESIYKENTEWVTSSNNTTVDFNSTITPFQGLKNIDCGAFTNGQYLRFINSTILQTTDFPLISLKINLKATFSNNTKFSIRLYNGATSVSSVVTIDSGTYNFSRTIINTYQSVVVPMSSFTLTSSSFDRLDIIMVGSNVTGFKLDNIILAEGISTNSPLQKAIISISTNSGVANATQSDDIFTMVGVGKTTTSASGKTITITTPTEVSQTITDGVTVTSPSENTVFDALALKANIASPTFTGVPTTPTPTVGTNTTQVASTAFVLANSINIPHLKFNNSTKTVWNKGQGDISNNTSFGEFAMQSNTTGSANTANGSSSLTNNTIGSNNSATGNSSLSNNTTGSNNSATGRNSLNANTTGVDNTANGLGALRFNLTGSYNSALGSGAGQTISTDAILTNALNSTFLGANTKALANNGNNEIVIGANAIGAGTNTVTIGNVEISATKLRGAISGGSFIKNGATPTNILLAGGSDIPQSTFQAGLGYTPENVANKNIANGYAGLGEDGKLLSAQLPSITISDTFVKASQAEMLSVIAETGDVVVRTDLNKSFILKGTNPTLLSDWQELLTPTSAVTTVFGRNGDVTAQSGDYTASQVGAPSGSGTSTGTNTGDNATNTQYSGLVSNATHTGDATGATVLTLATVNANVGTFGSTSTVNTITTNGKGLITAIASSSIQVSESQVTNLVSDLALKAPLASPALTGIPTAPTATAGTNTTQLATTAFVQTNSSSIVAQTITNGVTTSAPSEDAVFDALSLKYNASNPSGYISDVNLTYTPSPTSGIVVNDKGLDATIPLADGVNAGLITSEEKTKISTAVQPTTLNSYVPYTGATTNADLGEFQIKAGQLEFDQTPTGLFSAGKVRWNDSDGTIEVMLKGGNVTLQVGQEQVLRVVNKTGINLLESQYKCVYISGSQGNRLKVDLALSNNSVNSSKTIGIVTENIDNNLEGFVTTSGLVRGINTTGSLQSETWVDGDILYLSATISGGITNILPVSPNHKVLIGYVVNTHITQGAIFVKVDTGLALHELHNVNIVGSTINKVVGSTVEGLWENKTISQVLGYTPENAANKDNGTLTTSSITYPTSEVVKTITDLKANIVSPTFTGTPTAPTAPTGTNTTQLATTAFVATIDIGNVKTIGAQNITGVKTFLDTNLNIINNTTTATRGLVIYQNTTDQASALIEWHKSRGSNSSPTNVVTGDIIGTFSSRAYIGGAYVFDRSLFGSSMTSTTGISQYITTGTTDLNYTPRLLVYENGNIGIGSIGGTIVTTLTPPNAKLQIVDTTNSVGGSSNNSAVNVSQTWNTTGSPTAIKLNISDSNSSTNSLLLDLQVGSISKFKVDKLGGATFTATVTSPIFVKSGATPTNILLAGGDDIPQSTFIGGTGTTNFIPKWTGSGAQVNSSMQQDANGNITINGGAGSSQITLNKATGASIALSGATGTSNYIVIEANNSTNPDLNIYVGGSIRQIIASSTGATTFSSSVTASNGTLIGGTGTTNFIPKWTGSGAQVNSSMQQDANGNITINGGAGSSQITLNKATGASIALSGATGTSNYIAIEASNSTNPDLNIYVGGSERLRIKNTGSIMIPNLAGTTSVPIFTDVNGNLIRGTASVAPIQLKDFYTDVNNVGITETDLYSYPTDISRLNATGEKIVAVYAGTFNDTTASLQIKVVYGGVIVGDTGALTMSVTGAWIVNTSIMRTGATTARAMVNISTPGASTASYTKYTSLTGLTFSNNNIIKITGTASGATGGDNDITATYGNIIWQPAAI